MQKTAFATFWATFSIKIRRLLILASGHTEFGKWGLAWG